MKVYEKLLFSAILVLLTLSSIALADVTDTTTVNVNVQAISQITLTPTTLTWNVQPGKDGVQEFLDIKNTGSYNVSQIYAYVDTLTDETSRPYGSPNATKYAAGGVIVFRNETYGTFFFAGRIEWNSTEDVSNKDLSNLNPATRTRMGWGFFRNSSYEYFWAVGNGTNGFCNSSGTVFAMDDDVDNGTTITRTPTTTSITRDGGDATYSYFSVDRATSALYESCVAVHWNCTKIYIYKYDKRAGFNTCANSEYIQNATLVPGDVHTLNVTVYVPYGVPDGNLNTATFTVYATAP